MSEENQSFNQETVDYFSMLRRDYHREEIVAEMVGFIFIDCEWEDQRDRQNLLQELIELVGL